MIQMFEKKKKKKKNRTLGFPFCQPPKKVLTKISSPKKSHYKISNPKKSSDSKFQTQKRASHIPSLIYLSTGMKTALERPQEIRPTNQGGCSRAIVTGRCKFLFCGEFSLGIKFFGEVSFFFGGGEGGGGLTKSITQGSHSYVKQLYQFHLWNDVKYMQMPQNMK